MPWLGAGKLVDSSALSLWSWIGMLSWGRFISRPFSLQTLFKQYGLATSSDGLGWQ